MTISRTSLTAFTPSMRDPDPQGARRFAQKIFHESDGKFIILHQDWAKGWAQRQEMVNLGELVHGKRKVPE